MIDTIKSWDESLFLFINSLNTEWLDSIMYIISLKTPWIPIYIFVLWYLYKKTNIKTSALLLIVALLGVALSDLTSVHLFKNVFLRYRPTHNENFGHLVHVVRDFNGNEYRGGMYGFVSSHAANFGMLAMLISLRLKEFGKKWIYLSFFMLILVCYSRIYLGVHYPADVFVGSLLGLSIGALLFQLLKTVERKYIHPKKKING